MIKVVLFRVAGVFLWFFTLFFCKNACLFSRFFVVRSTFFSSSRSEFGCGCKKITFIILEFYRFFCIFAVRKTHYYN